VEEGERIVMDCILLGIMVGWPGIVVRKSGGIRDRMKVGL
jgi:hypothetical protein